MTITKLLFNPLSVLIVLALCGAIIWSLRQTSQKNSLTNQSLLQAKKEVEELKNTRQEMEQKTQQLQLPYAQEKIIRDELLLQKPDEAVIQLPALPTAAPVILTPSPTPRPIDKWLKLIRQN